MTTNKQLQPTYVVCWRSIRGIATPNVWRFFYTEESAYAVYRKVQAAGWGPTMFPYDPKRDQVHLSPTLTEPDWVPYRVEANTTTVRSSCAYILMARGGDIYEANSLLRLLWVVLLRKVRRAD